MVNFALITFNPFFRYIYHSILYFLVSFLPMLAKVQVERQNCIDRCNVSDVWKNWLQTEGIYLYSDFHGVLGGFV